MKHRRPPHSGFSLIEMAIIVMIIGVLAATILPKILSSIQRDVTKRGKTTLTTMRDEILGFAAINGNLPTLSSLTNQNDVWGNPFTYIVARDTTGGTLGQSLDGTININDSDSTNLSVVDGATGQTLASNVAFVLASRGPDHTIQLEQTGAGTLNHVVTVYPNGYSGGTVTNPFDDIVEYSTLTYAKGKAASSAGASPAPGSSDVSLAQDVVDFQGTQLGDVAIPESNAAAATVNSDGTIEMGGAAGTEDYACVWYQGEDAAGKCSNGVCELNYGIRAYFVFQFADVDSHVQSRGRGSGFTFSVVNGANAANNCGGSDELLGYAGTGTTALSPPKMAIEIDTSPDSSLGDPNVNPDRYHNHAAFVYSGASRSVDNTHAHHTTYTFPTTPPGGTVNHNPMYNDANSLDKIGFVTTTGNIQWLEDALPHTMRIEIYRNASAGSGAPSYGEVWNSTVWIDCTDSCSDLGSPYAGGAAKIVQHNCTVADNATMPTFRFGWTEGTPSGTNDQTLTISSFGIKFLTEDKPSYRY